MKYSYNQHSLLFVFLILSNPLLEWNSDLCTRSSLQACDLWPFQQESGGSAREKVTKADLRLRSGVKKLKIHKIMFSRWWLIIAEMFQRESHTFEVYADRKRCSNVVVDVIVFKVNAKAWMTHSCESKTRIPGSMFWLVFIRYATGFEMYR